MKHLSVGIAGELWETFKSTYALKNGTTPEAADTEATYEARDIMCDAIKAYVHNCEEIPDPHRTAKEINELINEVNEIAKSVPGMTIQEGSKSMHWFVEISGIYEREARSAEQLLQAVKEGKGLADLLQEIKAEQSKDEDESEAIRIESLDHSTKEILLHFIESLTIRKAVDIVADGNYPHLALDELYAISVQLKLSIVEGDDWR